MENQKYIEHDMSLFNRLKRLFSNDVVIRNVGGNELKVVDINKIQRSGKYQTNSLLDRFSRLYIYNNKNIFNPNLNYQTLRIQLYSDYEAMDTDAIVSSALDVVADECLLKNDRGNILSITSSDENIKRTLENLFYDVLNVDFNLWGWVRGMLKYGDFFLKLEISEKFGIYNVLPYSIYHISRLEGQDPNNPSKVVFQLDPDGLAAQQDPNYVKRDGKGVIQLENYEVAHFRLITDTNYLPYGRSYIEPARKIFKQLTLCLPGTAKLWTPEGYVLMENIKTGDRIYSYDYATNSYVESEVTFKINTGLKPTYEIRTEHRKLEASGDHPVMVSDGTMKKVSDLKVGDFVVIGKNLEVNSSVDINQLGPVDFRDFLRRDADVLKFLRFIGYVFREGEIREQAVYFPLGQELGDRFGYIEYLRNQGVDVGVESEGLYYYAKCQDQRLLSVFEQLGYSISTVPEWLWNASLEQRVEILRGFFEEKKNLCATDRNFVESVHVLAQQSGLDVTDIITYSVLAGENPCEFTCNTEKSDESGVPVEEILSIDEVSGGKPVYDITVKSKLHNFVADGIVVSNCEDAAMIHRIMRAPEKRIFYINVGQIPPNEVDQFMEKTINNMKKTPYVGADGQYNLKFNMQNMMEDFYIPVRGGDSSTRVETTPGLNYDGITDIQYYQQKLFAALKIPKAYLGFDEKLSGKATLSAEDIRFARTIERIQRIIESELTKIAIVHLYARGFTGESLANFEIRLTTPSVIFEQEKVALLKEKVDLAGQMRDSGLFSSDYIYENVFNLSESEYLEMRDLVREDDKRDFRSSQIKNEGNDPALSGRSYGTPHDLASMYGRRSSPAPKGAESKAVPAGYEEKDRVTDHQAWKHSGPEGGQPRKRASFIGTQDNPLGSDPTGRLVMHGGFPSDYGNEGYDSKLHEINLDFKAKETDRLNRDNNSEDILNVGMLSEQSYSKVDRMLFDLGKKLNKSKCSDKQKVEPIFSKGTELVEEVDSKLKNLKA